MRKKAHRATNVLPFPRPPLLTLEFGALPVLVGADGGRQWWRWSGRCGSEASSSKVWFEGFVMITSRWVEFFVEKRVPPSDQGPK